jgi:hypothetical protein
MTAARFVEVFIHDSQRPTDPLALREVSANLRACGWNSEARFSPLANYQTSDHGALPGERLLLIGVADRYRVANFYGINAQGFATVEDAIVATRGERDEFIAAQLGDKGVGQ